jgi:iron-sulfur cluster assembly protein
MKDGFYVTTKAAEKIMEFAANENKEGQALRITAHDNNNMEPAYAMDFEEKSQKGDKVFEFHGVKVHLDKESAKNLEGAEVDYLDTAYGSGFKIFNPQFTGNSCGCGSGGGCGCGSGGCGCH